MSNEPLGYGHSNHAKEIMQKIVVAEEQIGRRLDVFATEQLPLLSRASAQKLCGQGLVLVNGLQCKISYKLRVGDEVTIDYDKKQQEEISDIDVPIIYEDDDCMVINKPVGLLTHSKGAFNPEATVATFLQQKLPSTAYNAAGREGIVHRLDRATSGVMICAKTTAALSWLQKQFAERKVKKTYMAVVQGVMDPEHAVIDMPIERNPKKPQTFRVGGNGKSAQTEYLVKQIFTSLDTEFSLLELKPTTGRTHQLRVHLKQLGHPIVGDTLYEGTTGKRLYLHAFTLEITLPDRTRQTFSAPLPAEFQACMESARG